MLPIINISKTIIETLKIIRKSCSELWLILGILFLIALSYLIFSNNIILKEETINAVVAMISLIMAFLIGTMVMLLQEKSGNNKNKLEIVHDTIYFNSTGVIIGICILALIIIGIQVDFIKNNVYYSITIILLLISFFTTILYTVKTIQYLIKEK